MHCYWCCGRLHVVINAAAVDRLFSLSERNWGMEIVLLCQSPEFHVFPILVSKRLYFLTFYNPRPLWRIYLGAKPVRRFILFLSALCMQSTLSVIIGNQLVAPFNLVVDFQLSLWSTIALYYGRQLLITCRTKAHSAVKYRFIFIFQDQLQKVPTNWHSWNFAIGCRYTEIENNRWPASNVSLRGMRGKNGIFGTSDIYKLFEVPTFA